MSPVRVTSRIALAKRSAIGQLFWDACSTEQLTFAYFRMLSYHPVTDDGPCFPAAAGPVRRATPPLPAPAGYMVQAILDVDPQKPRPGLPRQPRANWNVGT